MKCLGDPSSQVSHLGPDQVASLLVDQHLTPSRQKRAKYPQLRQGIDLK